MSCFAKWLCWNQRICDVLPGWKLSLVPLPFGSFDVLTQRSHDETPTFVGWFEYKFLGWDFLVGMILTPLKKPEFAHVFFEVLVVLAIAGGRWIVQTLFLVTFEAPLKPPALRWVTMLEFGPIKHFRKVLMCKIFVNLANLNERRETLWICKKQWWTISSCRVQVSIVSSFSSVQKNESTNKTSKRRTFSRLPWKSSQAAKTPPPKAPEQPLDVGSILSVLSQVKNSGKYQNNSSKQYQEVFPVLKHDTVMWPNHKNIPQLWALTLFY